jgi:hypothetical protein
MEKLKTLYGQTLRGDHTYKVVKSLGGYSHASKKWVNLFHLIFQ